MIEQLTTYRTLWDWPQAWVAEMLRVSRHTLSRWERGKNKPSKKNQEKVEALVATLEKVQSGDQPPTVEIHTDGDMVGGDKVIGRDNVEGDVITTTDGTTYVIKDSVVMIIITDPETLEALTGK